MSVSKKLSVDLFPSLFLSQERAQTPGKLESRSALFGVGVGGCSVGATG